MFPTRFSASLPFHAVCSCLHYHTLNSPTSSWFAESQVIQTAQVWLSFSFDTNVYSYHKGHRKLCKNFHNQWGESICWIVLKKFDLCFVVFFFSFAGHISCYSTLLEHWTHRQYSHRKFSSLEQFLLVSINTKSYNIVECFIFSRRRETFYLIFLPS